MTAAATLAPLDDRARARALAAALRLLDWDRGNPGERCGSIVMALSALYPGCLLYKGAAWQMSLFGVTGPIGATPRRAIEAWTALVRTLPPGSRIHVPAGKGAP